MEPFSDEAARRAIEGPLKTVGWTFGDKLVDIIIKDLKNEEGIESSTVQLVCNTLWANRPNSESKDIPIPIYKDCGGADRILGSFKFDHLKAFPYGQHKLMGRIIDKVKSLDDTIRSRPDKHLENRMSKYKYDVFISYAAKNQEQAKRIYRELSKKGLKCFMAEKTIETGVQFTNEIKEALLKSRELCFLFTPESKKSMWILAELGAAWVLDRRIVPITHRLDIGDLADLPGMFASYQGKDFSDLNTYVNEVKKRRNSS